MRVLIISLAFFAIPTAAYLLFLFSERVKRLRRAQQILEQQARRQALYIEDTEEDNIRKYKDGA
jgi:hypothetical protein